jgi:hypothetical protein
MKERNVRLTIIINALDSIGEKVISIEERADPDWAAGDRDVVVLLKTEDSKNVKQ